ncbi:MAG: hypothetical protein ACODAU_05920 [Myxococcota bacterium]
MRREHSPSVPLRRLGTLLVLSVAACGSEEPPDVRVDPVRATHVATVSPRFQSFNVEMQQVVQGDFWGPVPGPIRVENPPYDFSRTRLRRLTSELSPAYMRISGSGASATYHDLSETPVSTPPDGYDYVLTREQWDAAAGFAMDLDLEILVAVAMSDGTRDENGAWTDVGGRTLLEHAASMGHPMVGVEFGNEPNALSLAGLTDPDYDGEDFGRDVQALATLRDEVLPEAVLVGPGPGNIGDAGELILGDEPLGVLSPEAMQHAGEYFDVVSYHFYPGYSTRCNFDPTITLDMLVTPEGLDQVDDATAFYEGLRDQHAPDAPLWNTETANAACGGDPVLADKFVDSIRYVDQLGLEALRGVEVNFHNTLSGGDYGLIDEETLEPAPNYWAAIVWHRLMGERVLTFDDSPPSPTARVYAHCTKDGPPGAVTVLAVNLDRSEPMRMEVAVSPGDAVQLYEMSAPDLLSPTVRLNGETLIAAADGSPPPIEHESSDGRIVVPPTSYAFAVLPDADAPACR